MVKRESSPAAKKQMTYITAPNEQIRSCAQFIIFTSHNGAEGVQMRICKNNGGQTNMPRRYSPPLHTARFANNRILFTERGFKYPAE
jgi:hypothetical protein